MTLNTDQDGLLWKVAQIVRTIRTRTYYMLLKKNDQVMLMKLSSITNNSKNSYDTWDLV